MSHAIVPAVEILLCLAAAFLVSWDLAPLVLKPRVRPGTAPLPDLSHVLPALRARLDAPPTRTDLPIPPPRCEYRGTQPRKTVHVIICDPAVTPVVPGYYRAYLAGWFRP